MGKRRGRWINIDGPSADGEINRYAGDRLEMKENGREKKGKDKQQPVS